MLESKQEVIQVVSLVKLAAKLFVSSPLKSLFPAGTWRKYNVASTSTQRHDVVSTLSRRCINVMCLLAYIQILLRIWFLVSLGVDYWYTISFITVSPCLWFQTQPWVKIFMPSTQYIWNAYGRHIGFNMGPIWVSYMGSVWGLQQGYIWDPYGLTMRLSTFIC